MKTMTQLTLVAVTVGMMEGCTPNISPDVIQSGNANEVTNTVQGKIVSMRTITVKGNDNSLGALGGAALGAVAGSAIGGGTRMNVGGALVGAGAGVLLGNVIQDKLSTQQGIEYIVKITEGGHKGNLLTIVQGAGSQSYTMGQCVYAVEGAHARIVGGC